MTNYVARIKSIIVCPEGVQIFSELCTQVSIEDEGGGEFVVVSQNGAIRNENEIAVEPKEWPVLRETIDRMISECGKDSA